MLFRRDPDTRRARQLDRVRADLARARENLRIAEEQFLVVDATADDAQVQMALEDTVLSARNNTDASRHAELVRHQMDRARVRVAELERREAEMSRDSPF